MELTEPLAPSKVLKQRNDELQETINDLRARLARLERMEEEKEYLIAAVAHDLRAPLHQIIGLARVIQMEKENLSDLQNECVAKIETSAAQLGSLVAKILDPVAIEANDLNVDLQPTRLLTVLDEAIASFVCETNRKRTSIELIDGGGDVHGIADAQYLRQVYVNLLSNAVKFTPPGGRIIVRIRPDGDTAITEIQDSGPGFTSDELERLFRKFQKFRARPTSNEPSYGLGLSIVKKYIDLMHGEISCESAPGEGAQFRITLPRAHSCHSGK